MFGETVTRIRRGVSPGLDRYQNPLPGVDVETPIPGAGFAPERASTELVGVERTQLTTAPTLYFQGGWPDIVATDRVRVRGDLYDVDGRPEPWSNPWTGEPAGMVVTLKRVEG